MPYSVELEGMFMINTSPINTQSNMVLFRRFVVSMGIQKYLTTQFVFQSRQSLLSEDPGMM